jgi:hypothetical protein
LEEKAGLSDLFQETEMLSSALSRRSDAVKLMAVSVVCGYYNNFEHYHQQNDDTITTTTCCVLAKSHQSTFCEASASSASPRQNDINRPNYHPASWLRRTLQSSIGIPLPVPRVLTPNDPALKLPKRYIQRRNRDEQKVRKLLEQAPQYRDQPEKIKELHEQIFEVTFGTGVNAQTRENFLVRYGCTGWNDQILEYLLDICKDRGIVEIGAGHGQWARALMEAFDRRQKSKPGNSRKKFDFVLAYDDMSSLPLNTHIYNPYTQPHHDYFGNVQKIQVEDTARLLQSWSCRGRALLLVYPSPGDMAINVVRAYTDAAKDNDLIIYVGEGRGGANGSDGLFDFFESGDWILVNVLQVRKPPGDKGFEQLFILQRK